MVQSNTGIKAIRLSMDSRGNTFVIHPTVLWDEQDVVLVDTGLPGKVDVIRAAFQEASIPWEKLTKIIITHQDMDHIGGLPEIVQEFGDKVQVLAHEVAVPYLAGEMPLVKSKALATPVKVDVVLQDGDVLPFAGGLQVVFTPGHTPDHISLYHTPSRTLITGDAMTADNGVLQSFNPAFTPDHETALASIAKFRALELDTVIAYHGGVCTENLQDRLKEIVEAAPVEKE